VASETTLLLVNFVIHRREVSEGDNILVEQVFNLLLYVIGLTVRQTGTYVVTLGSILSLFSPGTTEISRTAPGLRLLPRSIFLRLPGWK
jgi:hypothetical protein